MKKLLLLLALFCIIIAPTFAVEEETEQSSLEAIIEKVILSIKRPKFNAHIKLKADSDSGLTFEKLFFNASVGLGAPVRHHFYEDNEATERNVELIIGNSTVNIHLLVDKLEGTDDKLFLNLSFTEEGEKAFLPILLTLGDYASVPFELHGIYMEADGLMVQTDELLLKGNCSLKQETIYSKGKMVDSLCEYKVKLNKETMKYTFDFEYDSTK